MTIDLVINDTEKIVSLSDGKEKFNLNEYDWLKFIKDLKNKKTQLHIRTNQLTKAKLLLGIELNPKYETLTDLVQAAIDKEIPLEKFQENLEKFNRVDLEFFELLGGVKEANNLIKNSIDNILKKNKKISKKINDLFEEKHIELDVEELWERIKQLQAEVAILTEILHYKLSRQK